MTDDAHAALVERESRIISQELEKWDLVFGVDRDFAAREIARRVVLERQAAMGRVREACAQYRDHLAEMKRKDAERQVSSSLRHDSQHQMVRHMDHAKALRALALPDATGEG